MLKINRRNILTWMLLPTIMLALPGCGGGVAKEGTTNESGASQASVVIKEEVVADIPFTSFEADDFTAKVPAGWEEKLNMFGTIMYAPVEIEACYRQASFQMLNPMDGEENEVYAEMSLEDHLKDMVERSESADDEVSGKGITRFGDNEVAFIITFIETEPGKPKGITAEYILKKGEFAIQLLFSCSEECWEEYNPATKFVVKSVKFK